MTRTLPRLLLALGLFALSPFALAQDASSAPVEDAAELGDSGYANIELYLNSLVD